MSFVGPTTMAGWQGVALRERLAAVTGLPSFIEADMVAAALGEHTYGPGARFSHYYYLYFGVGLGGAVVQDGAVMRGAWGNAGEIGHIPVVPDGEPCPCGNRGCLERYLSLDAQRRQDRDEAGWVEHVTPVLRNAITTIENCSTHRRWCSAASHPHRCWNVSPQPPLIYPTRSPRAATGRSSASSSPVAGRTPCCAGSGARSGGRALAPLRTDVRRCA